MQTASKSAYKHRRYLLWNNATASLNATVKRPSVIYEKSEKHHTSSSDSYTDVRHSISTKLCLMIEEFRAIIAPLTFFGSDQ